MGPVIDPKMCNLLEINRIFGKISVIYKSVCFNNDRVIIQQALKYVENYSDH